MKQLTNRRAWMVGLSVGAMGIAAVIAACGGSSSSGNGGNGGGDGGGNGNNNGGGGDGGSSSVSTTPGSCANSTVAIDFSPMYSAFIPGSTTHTFQLPAVVRDGSSATWSASDESMVALAPDSSTGGVMITVQGTGTVQIIATKSDGTCGASTLKITSSTEDDWTIGNARYNDGVVLHLGPPAGFEGGIPEAGLPPPDGGGFHLMDGGSFFEQDGGTACTNCHGPTASSVFKDVSHTPEQTGGFSDDDLIQIITQGVVPDGGYFDPNVIIADASGDPTGATQAQAYAAWQSFHRWSDITTDEQAGIVVYLRSLQPAAQNGSSNFGGPPGGQHP